MAHTWANVLDPPPIWHVRVPLSCIPEYVMLPFPQRPACQLSDSEYTIVRSQLSTVAIIFDFVTQLESYAVVSRRI